jgi:beta-N-acetylhexosaminidase
VKNRRLVPVLVSAVAALALGSTAACASDVGNGAKVSSSSPSARGTDGSPSSGSPTSDGSPAGPGSTRPSSGPTSTKPSSTTEPGGSQTCARLAGQLSLKQQVGQLFMVGTGSSGMPLQQSRELAELKIGSVILLDQSTAGKSTIQHVTSTIRDRVGTSHGIGLMLAVDQEGGQVQRLKGPGFDSIPSAVEQGQLSPSELTRDATTWGEQLADAGIDVDLAPVADVVPKSMININQPIGVLDRGYGSSAKKVEKYDLAFIHGMQKAKIATTVKHFPNLGRVRGNTDFDRSVVDDETTRDDASLGPYRGAVDAGVDMVMVSSAVYSRIDAKSPATFSSTVVGGMIRKGLKYDGVIVSDALEGKALGDTPEPERALKFIRAGGDLALIGDPQAVRPMVRNLRDAAQQDDTLRQRIKRSTERVLIMKSRYGLADCTP